MALRELRIAKPDPVARYATLDGALRAATHLVELDYEPADVAVSPRDFELVEPDRLRTRVLRGIRQGAALSTVVVVGVWLLSTIGPDALVGTLAPLALAAAVVGAIGGVVAGVVQHRRAKVMTWGIERPELVPHSFDVVVNEDPDQAGHELARWWDPDAPPARWRQSA
jgi:hypothetical protein